MFQRFIVIVNNMRANVVVLPYDDHDSTTWKTGFDNGHRSPLVMGNAPVTDQLLQISQER
jgi:hypothetical protein